MPRRMHLRVKTAAYLRFEDMARYLGYRGVPVTPEPIKRDWAGSRCTVHRFEEGAYTYLRQPSLLNRHWLRMGIDRYASFGVRDVEAVLR